MPNLSAKFGVCDHIFFRCITNHEASKLRLNSHIWKYKVNFRLGVGHEQSQKTQKLPCTYNLVRCTASEPEWRLNVAVEDLELVPGATSDRQPPPTQILKILKILLKFWHNRGSLGALNSNNAFRIQRLTKRKLRMKVFHNIIDLWEHVVVIIQSNCG